jgi:CCR4-NOT transcription complex subunit 7/8
MPPHGQGRFPGHNLSNPFAHLTAPIHTQPQLQQQQQHQQQQNIQHPAFGGGNQAHNLNLFGPNQGGFQSHAGGIGGGLGGGLGAAAGIGGTGGGTGLDGQEARMRFAHGAQLQENAVRGQDGAKAMVSQRIREVWKSNLYAEMDVLRSLIDQYPYISMVSMSFFGGTSSKLTT